MTTSGYTILGTIVGEGFDISSILSSFTGGFLSGGGNKAPAQPSQAQMMQQMQLQQEAQRAKDEAARARTAAWAVGGIAGLSVLGIVLWKALK